MANLRKCFIYKPWQQHASQHSDCYAQCYKGSHLNEQASLWVNIHEENG